MALAALPADYWLNNDGLLVKYGRAEGIPGSVGEFQVAVDGEGVVELDLNFSHFTGKTADAAVILDYDSKLPAGAIIGKIIIEATDVWNTLTTIDVGLVREDMTTTYDEDGLVVDFPLASMNSVGERTEIISTTATYPGALWATGTAAALPFAGYIVGSFAGTAPTTGRAKIWIHYLVNSAKANGPNNV